MPDGKEFVPIEVGSDDNNDSDWGEAAGSVLGTGKVGITPAMAVLGSFTEVRTTPNAYGHKFNLLAPYDWTPETDRSVDLGMTGSDDDWNTVVVTTPWGTNLFYLKLPQTGDELMPWLFGLTLLGAAALLLVLISRRKEEDEEEEGEEE
ncbi:LPXTG cell wall anchor domain-containing protein [Adlercreutzia muris]|uniref:LPXTG cell wall anchor domain-containing protein n=2 Tax=Adlercreutzia muris TaxID=1796610 RepID=A0A7C8BSV0_9ACTN|nr:LPXTG cell wall anchor domain-containing protein [Adlercreutzia muris]NCA33032.1 LPXTG cell wall anchor domain-containing protein [Adlercreutzia muris]